MANIDITGLFSDVLGSTEQQQTERELQRRDAEAQAKLVGQLGGMAAYLAPQRSAALSSAAGGLLGLDTRTEADKLKEQLQSLGTPSTPEEHQRYADLLDKLRPGSGVQYMMSVAQERRAEETVDIEGRRADISKIQAEAAAGQVALGQDQLTSLDAERLRLDKREEANRALEEMSIEAENARTEAIANQTSVTAINLINEAVQASVDATQEGLEAKQIADDLARLSPTAGALGRFEERKKSFFGNEDNVTDLRTRINKMTVSIVMQGLPPGAASDKDIELAQSTVPTSTMNPEMLESYFRGVAKISALNAYKENLKAKHLSANNGSLAGFIEVWDEAQKAEGFLDTIKKASGYDWVNEEKLKELNEESAANRKAALKADAAAIEARKKEETQDSRVRAAKIAQALNSTRGYTL